MRLAQNTRASGATRVEYTMQVDEELKGEIYTDMMKAILKFEIRVK